MERLDEQDDHHVWTLSQEKLDNFEVSDRVIVNGKAYVILKKAELSPSILESMKVIHEDGQYIITIVFRKTSILDNPPSLLHPFPRGDEVVEERIRWTAGMPPFESLEVHYQPLRFSINGKEQFVPHETELKIDTIERYEITQKNGRHIVSGDFKQSGNDESGDIKKDDTCQVFDGKMSWSGSVLSTEALGKSLKNYGLDWINKFKWFSKGTTIKPPSLKSRTILRCRMITKPDGTKEWIWEWIRIYK